MILTTLHSHFIVSQFNIKNAIFFKGSSQKKITAPDMFTESDDMFAAYFDVGNFTEIFSLEVLFF